VAPSVVSSYSTGVRFTKGLTTTIKI
jgi:hypothetical protein